jgi:hypothetical protein
MGTLAASKTDSGEKDKFSPASKFIELVEYDPKTMQMDVTFKSGSKHKYFLIYPSTFLSFKKSPSHDAFFSRALKGTAMSIKIIDANIGRKESAPLKKVKKEHHLDRGIRDQNARNKWIAGTVARAFNAGSVSAA